MKSNLGYFTSAFPFAALSIAVAASAAGKIDFEYTGTVFDADTRQPLEGAYVVAAYMEERSGLAASKLFCVKTKGMYTGADGKYHFPVEKLDGRSPASANAIKSGYYTKDRSFPIVAVQRKQNAESYAGRHIFLKKQDLSRPDRQLSGDLTEQCADARTQEAAAAAAHYMKLKVAEYRQLKGLGMREEDILSYERRIRRYEELPSEAASVK